MTTILEFCLDLRTIHRDAPGAMSDVETHYALAHLRRHLTHHRDPSSPFDSWDRRFIIAAHDEVKARREDALFRLRERGAGTLIVERDGFAVCPGCLGRWRFGDLSRVGKRCGNLLCPDRRVLGAAS